MSTTDWVPEIFYEEASDGITSHIPFIVVPDKQEMPPVLFIFESRETGEFEPDTEGNELPINEITLHQFADMQILKDKLSVEEYDQVRVILGLLPLEEAIKSAKPINDRVIENI